MALLAVVAMCMMAVGCSLGVRTAVELWIGTEGESVGVGNRHAWGGVYGRCDPAHVALPRFVFHVLPASKRCRVICSVTDIVNDGKIVSLRWPASAKRLLIPSAATGRPRSAARVRVVIAMEDCCAVCAGPLMFCAFGPCHHQEVCSSCVARMRLLQKNTDCAICRKPCPTVFVTRYMDSHTKRVPESAWEDLRVRACILTNVQECARLSGRGGLQESFIIDGGSKASDRAELIRQRQACRMPLALPMVIASFGPLVTACYGILITHRTACLQVSQRACRAKRRAPQAGLRGYTT